MDRLRMPLIVIAMLAVVACSRHDGADTDLADAQAEADEATAQDFSGPRLSVCGLLAPAEVAAVLGPLSGPPLPLAEDVRDSGDARCVWQAQEGRELIVGGASEGGAERLAAIEPHTAPDIAGGWEHARLQGCCTLHAVKDQALVTLEFGNARIDLQQAVGLMNAALGRVHEPLETP